MAIEHNLYNQEYPENVLYKTTYDGKLKKVVHFSRKAGEEIHIVNFFLYEQLNETERSDVLENAAKAGYQQIKEVELIEEWQKRVGELPSDYLLIGKTTNIEPLIVHSIPEEDPEMYAFLRQNR